jgi:uncharacterized protein
MTERVITRTTWEIPTGALGQPIRGEARVLEGERPKLAVVICHGFKGFREWGFFPSLARGLAVRGYAAITFDLTHNGVGDDGVDFSDLDRFAEQTHTGNLAEISAVLDIIDDGILPDPPEKVVLLGHSRGGAEALIVAANDRRVDGLITWSAIGSIEGRWSAEQIQKWERGETVFIENARTHQQMPIGPGYWADIISNRSRLDVPGAAARLTVPWLLVHGESDETVSPADARALFDAAGTNAELCLIEGASHTFGATHPYGGATDELKLAFEATSEWLQKLQS